MINEMDSRSSREWQMEGGNKAVNENGDEAWQNS